MRALFRLPERVQFQRRTRSVGQSGVLADHSGSGAVVVRPCTLRMLFADPASAQQQAISSTRSATVRPDSGLARPLRVNDFVDHLGGFLDVCLQVVESRSAR